MRIGRLGEFGKERAVVIVSDTEAVFVDDVVGDWSRDGLHAGAMEKVRDRKSTRLNSRHVLRSRMPSSA